ncbi:MAG TPA: DMT family transporter [Burkholderiaceae bacterium]
MSKKLSSSTALLLTIPPLLWAINMVLGRVAVPLMPPMLLNFTRWLLALLFLLPLAGWVLRARSGLWPHWRRFALLGLLGTGCYNALQYLALTTSSPINVSLVASSIPLWMLAVGRVFFGVRITRRQMVGAVLSIAGVLLVLARGQWRHLLDVHLVPGDIYVLLAALSWAFYSWLLIRRPQPGTPDVPDAIRANWAAFLLAQVVFGLGWSGLFAAGEALVGTAPVQWSGKLLAILLFIAVGPAIVAFRCWGVGLQRTDPALASFFVNLTPLFAAVLSAAFLGEAPHLYHAVAFLLIVGGIVVTAWRR